MSGMKMIEHEDTKARREAGEATEMALAASARTTRDPVRVLYFARAPFVSGAERALLSMLRHLDRGRFLPGVVLGCDSALRAEVQALNVPVWIAPMPRRDWRQALAWWRSVRLMRRIARDWRAEILHANDVPSCQAMSVVGGQLGLPRVTHVRWGIAAGDMGWWARGGCEAVICISDWVCRELGDVTGTPLREAKIEVIHDAVDWPAESPSASPTHREPHEALTLGFSGQLIESKGLELVIRAMGLLDASQRPRLLVAGKDTQTGGAYQRHLETLASECGVAGNIDWLGFLPRVEELYQRIDAVVCPSLLEPLGLVPLEAAAFHVPALANNLGGFRETIRDGETGLLVEPTPVAWAGAIVRLDDAASRRGMGQAAHDHIRAAFSPMKYQQRLASLYDGLARRM